MRLSLLAAAALLFVSNGQASLVSKGNAVRRVQDGRRRHNYPVALSRRSRSVTKKPRRPLRTRAAVPSSQEIINSAFSIATFAPQPLWLMMIGFPNASLTKQVMRTLLPILTLGLLHLTIVAVAAASDNSIEQIKLFGEVFDPTGFPLSNGPFQGMKKLFQVDGFIAEEWPHVLLWDLFVGRMIYLDGLNRGIYTPHSILLCNLIGPPGLLLHAATCLATGHHLPDFSLKPNDPDPSEGRQVGTAAAAAPAATSVAVPEGGGDPVAVPSPPLPELEKSSGLLRADETVLQLFSSERYSPKAVAQRCAEDVLWEDFSGPNPELRGRAAVLDALENRPRGGEGSLAYVIDRVADGAASTGFTWHREAAGVDGGWGLRGTTYLELNSDGEIQYVREIAEPLAKPGGSTEGLLKAIARPDDEWYRKLEERKARFKARKVAGAEETVRYLWEEVQGQAIEEVLSLFAENVIYEDFNFEQRFRGKEQVSEFLTAFNIPGITFVPERFSQGDRAACFTWHVEIAGISGPEVRGISFYELDSEGRVAYVRDIAEPTIKPPPLLALASTLRPGLRRFTPASPL